MKKHILAIVGSASPDSSNQRLVEYLVRLLSEEFEFRIMESLRHLPHFDPALSTTTPPETVAAFRKAVEQADGILICTPEYIFSIPSGLKNALEWCVATTVFDRKPVGLITASAHGAKGHEELKLIMETLSAKLDPETMLLISGVKGKINQKGAILNSKTAAELEQFTKAFRLAVSN